MQRYILFRLVQAGATLLAVSLVVFILARLTGNPLDLLMPIDSTPEQYAQESQRLGLDKPLYVQFGRFLVNSVQADLGKSIRTGRPVLELLRQRFPNTMKLGLSAMALALAIAFPLGILAAVRRGSFLDGAARTTAVFGQSLPSFWVGILLLSVFAGTLHLLPAGGAGGLKHYLLPTVTLALTGFMLSGVVRLLRSSMLDVLDSEYVKLARAKGLSENVVVWKHALKNALIPVVTFVGFYFALLLGGASVVVETVFAWPGVGRLAYEAVMWRDYPVVQAVVLLLATLLVAANLVVDILYAYLDPRVRYR
ncbi:MAG: ABC transporter permease [Chloroflexi bacterium]|nr:ABC transporter permease [Chloroflexota bacterium]